MAVAFKSLAVIGVALVGGGLWAAPVAADPAANPGQARRGARLAYSCLGCHGIPNYRNAYPNYHVPKLGGQHSAYLASALGEYRAGARPHPTMRGQAAGLSDQDARDLAAYFATDTPVKSDGRARATAPAAAQVCGACHGQDGVGILPEYPTLSGQHPDYIAQALKAYRQRVRRNAIMNGFAATLTDADIHALAHYFSQQTPALWVPLPPQAP
jgi:cytochrome c553